MNEIIRLKNSTDGTEYLFETDCDTIELIKIARQNKITNGEFRIDLLHDDVKEEGYFIYDLTIKTIEF